ncbi:MAG: FtsX-like permease family protein [Promethearchaeota archaeon]
MKRRKVRYILTAIALIISVSLFGGVSIVSDSFEVMMIDTIDKQLGSADVLFKPSNSTDGWFDPTNVTDDIESLGHISSVAYRISGFDVYASPTDSGTRFYNGTETGINGINIHDPSEQALGGQPFVIDSLRSGTSVEELLDYTHPVLGRKVVVITQSLKIELGKDFSVNDSIWILPYGWEDVVGKNYEEDDTGTWEEFAVVAIIRDTGEARNFETENTTESSMGALGAFMGPGIFLNISNAYLLADGNGNHTGEYNLGVIGTDSIYNVDSVTENLQSTLDALDDGLDWKTIDLKTDSLQMIHTTMSILRTVFMIFGIIALLLAVILMMNIFNIIRKEQEYETGMFQAIGASKGETFKMFLTQGALMGIIGSTIGTVASYGISYLIFTAVTEALRVISSSVGGLEISKFVIVLLPETLATTFLIGLVACILASIYPSWKASRKPIIECLNPIEEKSKRAKKHVLRRVVLLILGISLIFYGYYLMSGPSDDGDIVSTGGPNSGVVMGLFGPILVLFGIIWVAAMCLKPLNKFVSILFAPYLRKTRLLTEKNILRHRKRTALTFIMIALTTSFLIGMSVMMDSIRAGIDTTIDNFMGSDIRVMSIDTPRSFETGLTNQTGVEDVMGVSNLNARLYLDDRWVGHALTDGVYNESVTVNMIDTEKIKERMGSSTILAPASTSLNDAMDELDSGYNIMIDKQLAEDFDVSVGDNVTVELSHSFAYAGIAALLEGDNYNVTRDVYVVNLTVSAIANEMKGFSSSDLLGMFLGQGVSYNSFVSWSIYEDIALQNIPGGGTHLMIKQRGDTGNPQLDLFQSNWFNISDVEGTLNNVSGINYYTTRMDSIAYTGTGASFPGNSSLIGIHVNSTGNFRSDSYFGNNSIIALETGYSGTTMEEVLNNTGNICVVDENFINNTDYNLGDYIYIFPFEYNLPVTRDAGTAFYLTYPLPYPNITITGDETNLVASDDSYLSIVSDQNNLAINITQNLNNVSSLFPYYHQVVSVSIESVVNETIDNLNLQVLNFLTGEFDTLGSITNKTEVVNTFSFNLNRFYVDPFTGNFTLRIVGQNSTFNGPYELLIDHLSFEVKDSTHTINPFLPFTDWEPFQIAGIVKSPTLHEFERYIWPYGYDYGYDLGRNSAYISYENARNIVYADYSGSNASYDMVTSILVHCDDPENITTIKNALSASLGAGWSVIDFRSIAEFRTVVSQWFIWIEPGANDEVVLENILSYIEDRGHLVIFSFTKSFMNSMFNTMINLIVFITNSLLIFCIVIAMIGLTLHSLLTTMARRREIGMLRSIGLSKKGVIRSISGETYVLAVLGLTLGILAGIMLGYLMVDIMPGGGFLAVTFTIPIITIIVLVTAVIITVLLSSRLPARWAANLNIIDAVRTR